MTMRKERLEVGSYNFTIVIVDQAGNTAADSVFVTVQEKEDTEEKDDDTVLLVVGLGIAATMIVAVIAAIGIFYRRYKT